MSVASPIRIELAWPVKSLSPNARVHYMTLHSAKKKAKDDAFWATRCVSGKLATDEKLDVRLTFHPPVNRDRDMDNAIASMKAALDGVALALDVNDSQFNIAAEWGENVTRGMVVVEIGGEA